MQLVKTSGRGVTRGTTESRLPARHYAICIYCWTSIFMLHASDL